MNSTSQVFMEWCLERVKDARGEAAKSGTHLIIAMYQRIPITVEAARARFPDIESNEVIRDLLWWAVQENVSDEPSEEDQRLEQSWRDWCNEHLAKATQDAVKHGLSVEEVVLRALYLYVNEIRDTFPNMDLSKALEELGSLARAADNEGASDPAQGPMPRKTWDEWCHECVEASREYATKNGTNIQTAMLCILSLFINETRARFPNIELRVALLELSRCAYIADRNAAREKPG